MSYKIASAPNSVVILKINLASQADLPESIGAIIIKAPSITNQLDTKCAAFGANTDLKQKLICTIVLSSSNLDYIKVTSISTKISGEDIIYVHISLKTIPDVADIVFTAYTYDLWTSTSVYNLLKQCTSTLTISQPNPGVAKAFTESVKFYNFAPSIRAMDTVNSPLRFTFTPSFTFLSTQDDSVNVIFDQDMLFS